MEYTDQLHCYGCYKDIEPEDVDIIDGDQIHRECGSADVDYKPEEEKQND
jgi:hypothetical protein